MDGAFYAIKGYAFQFDKSLLELLNCEDEQRSIGIEQIQDLNTDDYVMQIKYKETCNFSLVQLREPVLQLIEEHKKDSTRNLFLYCHFKDKDKGSFVPNKEDIEVILSHVDGTSTRSKSINDRIDLITSDEKEAFCSKFTVVFAPEFHEQYTQVLEKLQEIYKKANEDALICYYSRLVKMLTDIVTMNIDQAARVCNKRDALQLITDARNAIFTSAFKEYEGEKKYFEFVKAKIGKLKKDRVNWIIFGDVEISASISLGELVANFVDSYYQGAKTDIIPPLVILQTKDVSQVKEFLIGREIIFNDGYESIKFSPSILCMRALINKVPKNGRASDSLREISFRLRIVSLDKVRELKSGFVAHKIYCFDADIPNEYADIPYFKAEGLDTSYLSSLLA